MSERNCVTYFIDGEILFKKKLCMPFRKHKAMKAHEKVQDPQNAFLILPQKYSKTPALYARCSAFSCGPRDEVFWARYAMFLLSVPTHSTVVPTIGHKCVFTDSVRFITQY
jgi:hypothetical protein